MAGEAGRLLVHSFSHGRGMRWWGLPGDHCDVRVASCSGVDQWVCGGQVQWGTKLFQCFYFWKELPVLLEIKY